MFVLLPEPREAIITRHGAPEVGQLRAELYHDDPDDKDRRGPLIAFCVRLDSGAEVFALPRQLGTPKDGEIEEIRAREAAALASIERDRAEMWGGGGRVVYTA